MVKSLLYESRCFENFEIQVIKFAYRTQYFYLEGHRFEPWMIKFCVWKMSSILVVSGEIVRYLGKKSVRIG